MAYDFINRNFYFPFRSSDTVSFFRPLARLRVITARPLAVDILCLKPCLFVLLRRLGWYVLFMLATLFWDREISRKMFPCYLWTENFRKKLGFPVQPSFKDGRFRSTYHSLSEDLLQFCEIMNHSGFIDKSL